MWWAKIGGEEYHIEEEEDGRDPRYQGYLLNL
jgi:hypothetical protein